VEDKREEEAASPGGSAAHDRYLRLPDSVSPCCSSTGRWKNALARTIDYQYAKTSIGATLSMAQTCQERVREHVGRSVSAWMQMTTPYRIWKTIHSNACDKSQILIINCRHCPRDSTAIADRDDTRDRVISDNTSNVIEIHSRVVQNKI
jgi:hypothetical protein